VYVLLGKLRYSTGNGLRWRWIDPVLGTVAGIVVLLYVLTLFFGGSRGLFSDAASSVSNAPGP
jgi:hypothetical protein